MELTSLIHELSKDLTPVKRLPSTGKRLMNWLSGAFVSVGFWILFFGLRHDIGQKLHEARFLGEGILLITIAILTAGIALFRSVPDLERPQTTRYVPFILVFGWILLLSGLTVMSFFHQEPLALNPGLGFNCVRDILAFGLIPGVLLFLMVRRAAPLEPIITGALILLAVTALGAFGTQLLCKNDRAVHLLVWHVLPILFLTVVGGFMGKRLLRW